MGIDAAARTEVLLDLDVRVGTDVESIADVAEAIQLHGDRYLHKLFTEHEVESCGGVGVTAEVLAPGLTARFAAKEAVLKVLQPTSLVPQWRDIEIQRTPGGWPEIVMSKAAAELAELAQFASLSLSMSHGAGVGMATVVGIRYGRTTLPTSKDR